jgi:AraC-like DNA-binding protein
MRTLVRAAALTNFPEVARHLGLNPKAELDEVGLSEAMLLDPDHLIPVGPAVQLLENAAVRSGCQTLGLLMAESRQLSNLGAMSLLLAHQPTLGEALRMMVQYRHLLNRALAIFIEEAGDLVIIRGEVVTDVPLACRQATELALGVVARLCANLLGLVSRPTGVSFSHDAPGDARIHQRVFGCRVQFGAEFNGIIYPAAAFDSPNPRADPTMARYAQRFVDSLPAVCETSLAFEVRTAIYVLLPMGRATVEQTSSALGMHVRGLQRRLYEDGVNFSDLINDVRRELVQRYMNTPGYALARIGALLGYSTPSSFTRWFVAQFGATPTAWRAAHGKTDVTTVALA